MSLTKRGKTWHTHFFVDGERFRQSLERSDWREAQAQEKTLIAPAKQGKLSASSGDFARLLFEDAGGNTSLADFQNSRSSRTKGAATPSEAERILPG